MNSKTEQCLFAMIDNITKALNRQDMRIETLELKTDTLPKSKSWIDDMRDQFIRNIKDLKCENEELRKKLDNCEAQLANKHSIIQYKNEQIDRLTNRINNYNRELTMYRKTADLDPVHLKKILDQKSETIKELNKRNKNYQKQIVELEENQASKIDCASKQKVVVDRDRYLELCAAEERYLYLKKMIK